MIGNPISERRRISRGKKGEPALKNHLPLLNPDLMSFIPEKMLRLYFDFAQYRLLSMTTVTPKSKGRIWNSIIRISITGVG
jgi:hypothetical protein